MNFEKWVVLSLELSFVASFCGIFGVGPLVTLNRRTGHPKVFR
jgi:hypothetical protein